VIPQVTTSKNACSVFTTNYAAMLRIAKDENKIKGIFWKYTKETITNTKYIKVTTYW